MTTLPRDQKLYSWETHKTPKAVAQFMRRQGANVGRVYKTHGDVWDASTEIVQTGLLHLILDELEKVPVDEDAELEKHAEWLRVQYPKLATLMRKHEKECQRIEKFCRLELLGRDVISVDPHRFSRAYRRSWGDHWLLLDSLRLSLYRLSRVRTLDDLAELKGIGPAMAKRIKEKMAKPK